MKNNPFIIAELSCNHGGSFETAMKLVKAAADASADAIKLQTWKTMVYDREYIIPTGAWVGRNLAELYDQAQTPWDWHKPLFDYAKELGITAFSTPFDYESLEFLESIDCPMYKVSSFEIVDIPLIKAITKTGKPIFISTGMASLEDIWEAFKASDFRATFLKCTSEYPASQFNLTPVIRATEWGISDHTEGIGIPIAAITLGASVIEKHLTLDKNSMDGKFSLLPREFKQMVTECLRVTHSLNCTEEPIEETSLRRSLYIAQDLKVGDVLTEHNLRTARPALGLHPHRLESLIGKQVNQDIKRGTPMKDEFTGG